MAQGKIVVEESPLATFFNQTLPNWSMNLLSMQARMSEAEKEREFRAAEAEKQREFKESQVYLDDLLSTKRMLTKEIYDVAKVATSKGLKLDNEMQQVWKLGQNITHGGVQATEDTKKIIDHNSQLTPLTNILSDIKGRTDMVDLGEQYAHTVDADNDGLATLEEVLTFEKQSGQKIPLPDDFRTGVNVYLGSKEGRKHTTELRQLNNALNSIKLWDIDPNTEGIQLDQNVPDKQLSHRRKAVAAIGKDNKKVISNVIESEGLDTTKGSDGLSAEDKKFDLDAKTQYQFVQDRSAKMNKVFQSKIGQTFQQEAPTGSFANNPDAWLRKIEPVLEEFFLNKKGIDEQGIPFFRGEVMKRTYKKYLNELKDTGSVQEIRATAIQKTLSDPDFIERIESGDSLFDVKGKRDFATDNFFKDLVTLYSMIDMHAGKSTEGYSWLGEKVGDPKGVAVFGSYQGDENWVYDSKTDTMLRKSDYEAKYGDSIKK